MQSRHVVLMILVLSLVVLQVHYVSASAQQVLLLHKTWGGSGEDDGSSIAIDASGNAYVTGDTNSFGAGGYDVFLLKYDSFGALEWQRTWGGSGNDYGRSVAVDSSGNIYVAGYTASFGAGASDVLLLKYNSTGSLVWQKTWGGSSDDIGYGVAVDSTGSVYVTGYTASYGAGGDDLFLLKFSASGTLTWQRTWGGAQTDHGQGLAVDSSGDVYVVGETASSGAGSTDALILKFNSTGSLVWQKTWGGSGGDSGQGAAVDSSGNIYVTGRESSFGAGNDDAFLLKLNSTGALLWQRTWGGNLVDQGNAVAVDSSGGVYIVGSTTSFGAGNSDVFILTLDSSGNLLSQKIWGAVLDDLGFGLALDPAGNPAATGFVTGFDTTTPNFVLSSSGNSTLGVPAFSLGTPTFALGVPTYLAGTPAGITGSPPGSESYAGARDVFLLKFATESSFSCAGASTCWVRSGSKITSTMYFSGNNTVQVVLNGTAGTHGFANVSVPKSAIPGQDSARIKVYVNSVHLSNSSVAITSNSTHFFVYANFTFHSPVNVDISLGILAVSVPPTSTVVLGLLLMPILLRHRRKNTAREI